MNWFFRSLIVGAMVGCLAVTPSCIRAKSSCRSCSRCEVGPRRRVSLTNGTSLYSGDVVTTESEGHVQLRVRQTRFELIGQSEAAFFPGANGAVAELRQGTMVVALNTPSESFEVFASDVRIVPKNERPVLAEVTMKATCDFQIKVMHGHLEATAAKETETLDEGHTYDVTPEFCINDSRNPAISPDAPEYHRGHQHSTCGLAAKSGVQPRFPTKRHFAEVVVTGATGVGTILVLREALESPDRP